ncbi:C40 family peptidase [Flindersiella endophytica]
MSNRRKRPSGRALLALGAASVAAVVAVPGASLADPTPSIAEVKKQTEKLHHEAEQAAELSNEYSDKMTAIQRKLKKLDTDLEAQRAKVQELRRNIGAFAAAEYRAGGMDSTMQLLLADDPDKFLAQMSSARALRGQQGDVLVRLRAEQKELAEREALQKAELARFKDAQKQAKDRLEEAKAKQAKSDDLLKRLTAAERQRLQELEDRQNRTSRGSDREIPSDLPPGSGRGAIALAFAKKQVGEPYVFGADGMSTWDCSGLTMMAWDAAGVSLPHSAKQQYYQGPKVSRSQLEPGDLVYYYSGISHVAIYAGNGMILHAPRPGKNVEYAPMDEMPYVGATRPG